jgi:deoxyribonucleoside regulator
LHWHRCLSTPEGQFVIIEDEIEKQLIEKNIVGNICTYYYDQEGNLQSFPIYDRLARIPIENLKNCAHIIAVAEGEEKAYATYGAIKAGLVTDLFIDEAIGRFLVSMIK